ncbi:MAG: pilus assembly protein [Rhizobiaceae bacterium]
MSRKKYDVGIIETMLRRFWQDKRGNYTLFTAAAMLPISGVLALSVDFSEMSKQRHEALGALDAAGIATARRIVEGASDTQAKAYAKDFFEANLNHIDPANTTLNVVLPANNTGGGTLKLSAELKYDPYFLPAAAYLLGASDPGRLNISASTEIRLKNTLEVALVLDNSGSMDYTGTGSGKKRMVLLKEAAKQLVDTLAAQSAQMKQLPKPVQFAVVPFAASVNIGADKESESWMDRDGISPVHHENFDWSAFNFTDWKVQKIGDIWYKKGSKWGDQNGQKMTRFQLYQDLQRQTGTRSVQTGETCTTRNRRTTCTPVYTDVPVYGSYASWGGCVEARPSPYNTNDAPASSTTPATFFVPMFAADETDNRDGSRRYAEANWWADDTTSSNDRTRQTYTPKYYTPAPSGTAAATGSGGPNASCTTTPITPLTDVSNAAGVTKIKTAIDAMQSNGATNVPEGMAWGWRVVSSGSPFTEGRAESEKGNDKVVIVLTDGANTYYTPSSLGYNDLASNKSTYSAYGYAGRNTPGYSKPRIFQDTSVSSSDYSNDNYTKALNAQFTTLCTNAKAAGLLVLTVSLDLSASNSTEKAQMDALKGCSSDSRFRKDPADATKPAKLYWNATGGNLAEKFKEIADELSNLRIVG